MIRIARYFYHELTRVWDTKAIAYRDRTTAEIRQMFYQHVDGIQTQSLAAFIKPYVLFPDQAAEVAETHVGLLRVDLIRHRADWSKFPVSLRLDGRAVETIADVLMAPRHPEGQPLLAEVIIYVE